MFLWKKSVKYFISERASLSVTLLPISLANGKPPRAASWQARERQDKAMQRQDDISRGRASQRYALPACGCNDPTDLCPVFASAWPCRYQRDARSTESRRGPACPAPNLYLNSRSVPYRSRTRQDKLENSAKRICIVEHFDENILVTCEFIQKYYLCEWKKFSNEILVGR